MAVDKQPIYTILRPVNNIRKREMRNTFDAETKCFLPNGGVAVMAADGTMLAYAKVAATTGKQAYNWVRKGFQNKFKRSYLTSR